MPKPKRKKLTAADRKFRAEFRAELRKKMLPCYAPRSARIRQVREAMGMTVKEFAREFCVSASHIASVEAGRTIPSNLLFTAIYYRFRQVNPVWYFTGKGEMWNPWETPPSCHWPRTEQSPPLPGEGQGGGT